MKKLLTKTTCSSLVTRVQQLIGVKVLSLFNTFGTTKPLSSNNYKVNIPTQLHNKLMNVFDFKHSSCSVNSNNNTTQVLNPVQYEHWSREEVYSLLCTPKENGGAGLIIEKINPLYDADFNGTSLANIVSCIQDKDKYFAMEQVKQNKYYQNISQTTLETVVNWVDHLLKTRLYHLWSAEQVKKQLCKTFAGDDGFSEAVKSLFIPLDDWISTIRMEDQKKIKNWKQAYNISTVEIKLFRMPSEITKENVNLLKLERFLINKEETTFQIPQTKILLSSFGTSFKFGDRTKTLEEIIETFKEVGNKIGPLDKKDVVLPFIAAAPGVGKSRLLKEVAISVSNSSIRNGIPTIPIIVSFGNGTWYSKNDEQDILQSLIARMVFSAIIQKCNIDYTSELFGDFLKKWHNFSKTKQYTLKESFIMVSNILGIDNQVDFFLPIDEAHIFGSLTNSKLENPLKVLMSKIGSYISTNDSNHKLYVMFAGTYFVPIESNLIESTYTPKYFPLSSFLLEESIELILDDLCSKKSKELSNNPSNLFTTKLVELSNWRTNREFRNYLRRFSGFPRGVETFIENYFEKVTLLSAWESSRAFLKSKYLTSDDFTIENILAKYVFSKKRVQYLTQIPSTQNNSRPTISELENIGVIMIDRDSNGQMIPVYPTVLLESLLPPTLQETFENIYFQNYNMSGDSWEKTIQNYHYLLFKLLGNEKQMKLSDLFNGAQMSKNTGDVEVLLPSYVETLSSCQQIHNEWDITTPLQLQDKQLYFDNSSSDCIIVKNGPSASAGDILIFGLKLSQDLNTILVIHLQGKWADSNHCTLTFEEIKKKIEKNSLFKFTNTNLKTRNISVILTGRAVNDLPESIPDDLIIVSQKNFDNYFVNFAGQSTFLHALPSIHINECNYEELQNFSGIGETHAEKIIKNRPSAGFKTIEELEKITMCIEWNNFTIKF